MDALLIPLSRSRFFPLAWVLTIVTDLIQVLATLVRPDGKILIPGLSDLVAPLTPEERARYEKINFSVADIDASTDSKSTISEDKVDILMAKMREPSLSLHGIEGAFYAPGSKTVIPASVVGKFSIRLVPDMMPDQIQALVEKHVNAEFAKLGSKNKVREVFVSLVADSKLRRADPLFFLRLFAECRCRLRWV